MTAFVFAALSLSASGCAVSGAGTSKHADVPVSTPGDASSQSALGAYLAARVAQQSGDNQSAANLYRDALDHDGDNTDLLQNTLFSLLAEGRFADAKPVAEHLLSYDSDAAWPLILLGSEAAQRSAFADARKHFAVIPRRSIHTVLGPLLLAWSLAGNGLTSAALEALSPLGQYESFKTTQALHAGMILDMAGQTEAAVAQYRIALSGPVNIRAVQAIGSALQRLGRHDEAQLWYNRYQSEHPDTLIFNGDELLAQGTAIPRLAPTAQAGMAAAFFDVSQLLRQGDGVDMSLVFNRLALYLQPDFSMAQLTSADLLSAQGRFDQANQIYKSIQTPASARAYAALKLAGNLDEVGDPVGALLRLEQLQKDHPQVMDIPLSKGDILRRNKRFQEATDAYTQALAIYRGAPANSWPLYFSRAVCFERAHNWPKAEADFRKTLELSPDQPDVLNYLGYTWIDMGLNLEEARGMIERAVAQRPNDGAIVDSLGWALFRMGQYDEAVAYLEKAVELKPVDATINEHLGDAYWQVGRQEEARMQWRRAGTMEPDPEQADGLAERNRTGRLPGKPGAK